MSERRSRCWALVLGAALAVAAAMIDAGVSGWMTSAAVGPRVEAFVGKAMGIAPVLIVLAILAAFPNRARLTAGFLTPILVHIPILHLLKWVIGRARPDMNLGAFHFEPLAGSHHCDAFPSGHAASAGVLALLLGIYFPRARWVFYVWAGLIGVQRIASGWHFLSDVIAGFVLAAAVVFGCVRMLGPAFYRRET